MKKGIISLLFLFICIPVFALDVDYYKESLSTGTQTNYTKEQMEGQPSYTADELGGHTSSFFLSTGTASTTYLTLSSASATYVELTGDTMTGTLSGTDVSMSGTVAGANVTSTYGVDAVTGVFSGNVTADTVVGTNGLSTSYGVKSATAQFTSGASANYFLKGDASGNASWSEVRSSDVIHEYLTSSSTYKTLAEYLDNSQSAGFFNTPSITDNGDGTVAVSTGSGFIRTTDSETGNSILFDWDADASVPLDDNDFNYIFVDYNSGTPVVSTAIAIGSIDFNTQIVIAIGYRQTLNIDVIKAGNKITNHQTTSCLIEFKKGIQRLTGGLIAETGERYLTVTEAEYSIGQTLAEASAIDTTGTDTFTYYWNVAGVLTSSSGWTQVNNLLYDNGTSTVTLGVGKYGVHWVYQCLEEDLYIQLGEDSYNLLQAQNALVPTPPDYLASFAILTGKIIVLKSASNLTSVQSAFTEQFQYVSVGNHNDLTNLQGGDTAAYYHLDATEFGFLDGQDQALKTTNTPTFSTGTITESLRVGAGVTCSTFTMDTGVTDNYVLTTDANGVGTWQAATGNVGTADNNTFTGDNTFEGTDTFSDFNTSDDSMMRVIYSTTFASATNAVTISGLDGDVDLEYRITISSGFDSSDVCRLTFNGDSGNNYNYATLYYPAATGGRTAGTSYIDIGTVNKYGFIEASICPRSGMYKSIHSVSDIPDNGGDIYAYMRVGNWLSTANVTSITLSANANNFAEGVVITLYARR